jgi:hypothetical protein
LDQTAAFILLASFPIEEQNRQDSQTFEACGRKERGKKQNKKNRRFSRI